MEALGCGTGAVGSRTVDGRLVDLPDGFEFPVCSVADCCLKRVGFELTCVEFVVSIALSFLKYVHCFEPFFEVAYFVAQILSHSLQMARARDPI